MTYLDIIPTSEPTEAPTEAPTITNKPTCAPTQMTSPIISFSSNITMNDVSGSMLDANSQRALVNVTAWSMKVTENTITYKKGIIRASNRRNLRSAVTLFTTSYSILAITQANVPLSSTGYTNPISLYNSMTSSITQAVNSGAFTKQLQQVSTLFNATQIEKANVTHVSNSALIINDIIYVTTIYIDEGVRAVTVILITIAMFIVICGVYVYCRSSVPSPIDIQQQNHERRENRNRFSSIIIF